MNYDTAITYCEEHECIDCIVYKEKLDKRTKQEKENLHFPCCMNLVNVDNKDL